MNARAIAPVLLLLLASSGFSQINISGANLHIQSGSTISIKGALSGNGNISGNGTIMLNDNIPQQVDINATTIPNLDINNPQNILLLSDLKISNNVNFSSGKIITNDHSVTFLPNAQSSNASNGKFIETGDSGIVVKILNNDLNNFEVPLGNGSTYHPAFINTTGTYNNAFVELKSIANSPSEKPFHLTDYLNNYWKYKKSGINGTVYLFGNYDQINDVSGSENQLMGYCFNGNDWTSFYGSINRNEHKVGTRLFYDDGILYAMNKFILLGSRAFLQGPYDPDNGLMEDALRTPVQYLPSSDPYRTSPYAANFSHINNPQTETIAGNPFADQTNSNDNIVDWVFLELRNTATSPGNQILSTRSALIQRDGDIVDIDGKSPVTFNGISDGVYALTLRHRNHLPISINPATSDSYLNENKSNAEYNLIDLRTASDDQLFGNSDGHMQSTHPILNRVNVMWAGNANGNSNIKYIGSYNDKSQILIDLGKNETNILNGYFRSDLNMDGMVKFSGYVNDRSYLLSNVLSNQESTIIREQKPF